MKKGVFHLSDNKQKRIIAYPCGSVSIKLIVLSITLVAAAVGESDMVLVTTPKSSTNVELQMVRTILNEH